MQLVDLPHRDPNFDTAQRHEVNPQSGWHIDELWQELPSEAPGEPADDGSWKHAQRLIRDYAFAEGSAVRAAWDRDAPLLGRDLVLEVRFKGLRFHVGVRVIAVLDETRRIDDREVRVWGWRYTTLEGHLEMGEMDYQVWKWVDSGDVRFRIYSFSRRAPIGNPIVRLGFRIFGRREQVRFYEHVCEYVAEAVARAGGRATWRPPPPQKRIAHPPAEEDSFDSVIGRRLEPS